MRDKHENVQDRECVQESGHTHEHSHSHSHTHTQEDGTTHTHVHDHTHSHTHDHAGDHDHAGTAGASLNRDRKILGYMIGHNAEHAQEMLELAARLREAGRTEAAAMIEEAAAGFEAANEGLRKAGDLLG